MHDSLRTIRTPEALRDAELITDDAMDEIRDVTKKYALSITPAIRSRIDTADDPVGRQFVPSGQELITTAEELADPIGDDPFTPVKGITHRYPDRLLLKLMHLCPVYCRFCFRREVVGPGEGMLSPSEIDTAIDYIRTHREIWEVIFTGGDPLHLSPARLGPILSALDEIEHVRVIRFHTRVPVVQPERITTELCQTLKIDTPVWIVVHTNHSQEIGPQARASLRRLTESGIPLLSQTVLLRGINDSAEALESLFRTLIANRVKPYYLHHGDLARGTAHFRTSIAEGQILMAALRGNVSGVCQPVYVLDIPGGHGKVPIGPSYLHPQEAGDDTYQLTDPSGQTHDYPPPTPRLNPLPPSDQTTR